MYLQILPGSFCHLTCTLLLRRIYVKVASWESRLVFASVQQLVALGVAQKLEISPRHISELRSNSSF